MASYFNLTLDTAAPAGVAVTINDGAIYTTTRNVTLDISTADSNTDGYQMKIWGTDGVSGESGATWEAFAATKTVSLPAGDGLKTVYIKVRDDVGNESAAASDTITLNTSVPTVTVTGPDRARLSMVGGFNKSIINFTVNEIFSEYKVCVVPASNSTQEAGQVIPTTGGSINTSGAAGSYPASTNIQVTIYAEDLESASSGDGAKIVKVFVRNQAGTWSVA